LSAGGDVGQFLRDVINQVPKHVEDETLMEYYHSALIQLPLPGERGWEAIAQRKDLIPFLHTLNCLYAKEASTQRKKLDSSGQSVTVNPNLPEYLSSRAVPALLIGAIHQSDPSLKPEEKKMLVSIAANSMVEGDYLLRGVDHKHRTDPSVKHLKRLEAYMRKQPHPSLLGDKYLTPLIAEKKENKQNGTYNQVMASFVIYQEGVKQNWSETDIPDLNEMTSTVKRSNYDSFCEQTIRGMSYEAAYFYGVGSLGVSYKVNPKEIRTSPLDENNYGAPFGGGTASKAYEAGSDYQSSYSSGDFKITAEHKDTGKLGRREFARIKALELDGAGGLTALAQVFDDTELFEGAFKDEGHDKLGSLMFGIGRRPFIDRLGKYENPEDLAVAKQEISTIRELAGKYFSKCKDPRIRDFERGIAIVLVVEQLRSSLEKSNLEPDTKAELLRELNATFEGNDALTQLLDWASYPELETWENSDTQMRQLMTAYMMISADRHNDQDPFRTTFTKDELVNGAFVNFMALESGGFISEGISGSEHRIDRFQRYQDLLFRAQTLDNDWVSEGANKIWKRGKPEMAPPPKTSESQTEMTEAQRAILKTPLEIDEENTSFPCITAQQKGENANSPPVVINVITGEILREGRLQTRLPRAILTSDQFKEAFGAYPAPKNWSVESGKKGAANFRVYTSFDEPWTGIRFIQKSTPSSANDGTMTKEFAIEKNIGTEKNPKWAAFVPLSQVRFPGSLIDAALNSQVWRVTGGREMAICDWSKPVQEGVYIKLDANGQIKSVRGLSLPLGYDERTMRPLGFIDQIDQVVVKGSAHQIDQVKYVRLKIGAEYLTYKPGDDGELIAECGQVKGWSLAKAGVMPGDAGRGLSGAKEVLPPTFREFHLLQKGDQQAVLIPRRKFEVIQGAEEQPLYGLAAFTSKIPVGVRQVEPQNAAERSELATFKVSQDNRLNSSNGDDYSYLGYLFLTHRDYENASYYLDRAFQSAVVENPDEEIEMLSEILNWDDSSYLGSLIRTKAACVLEKRIALAEHKRSQKPEFARGKEVESADERRARLTQMVRQIVVMKHALEGLGLNENHLDPHLRLTPGQSNVVVAAANELFIEEGLTAAILPMTLLPPIKLDLSEVTDQKFSLTPEVEVDPFEDPLRTAGLLWAFGGAHDSPSVTGTTKRLRKDFYPLLKKLSTLDTDSEEFKILVEEFRATQASKDQVLLGGATEMLEILETFTGSSMPAEDAVNEVENNPDKYKAGFIGKLQRGKDFVIKKKSWLLALLKKMLSLGSRFGIQSLLVNLEQKAISDQRTEKPLIPTVLREENVPLVDDYFAALIEEVIRLREAGEKVTIPNLEPDKGRTRLFNLGAFNLLARKLMIDKEIKDAEQGAPPESGLDLAMKYFPERKSIVQSVISDAESPLDMFPRALALATSARFAREKLAEQGCLQAIHQGDPDLKISRFGNNEWCELECYRGIKEGLIPINQPFSNDQKTKIALYVSQEVKKGRDAKEVLEVLENGCFAHLANIRKSQRNDEYEAKIAEVKRLKQELSDEVKRQKQLPRHERNVSTQYRLEDQIEEAKYEAAEIKAKMEKAKRLEAKLDFEVASDGAVPVFTTKETQRIDRFDRLWVALKKRDNFDQKEHKERVHDEVHGEKIGHLETWVQGMKIKVDDLNRKEAGLAQAAETAKAKEEEKPVEEKGLKEHAKDYALGFLNEKGLPVDGLAPALDSFEEGGLEEAAKTLIKERLIPTEGEDGEEGDETASKMTEKTIDMAVPWIKQAAVDAVPFGLHVLKTKSSLEQELTPDNIQAESIQLATRVAEALVRSGKMDDEEKSDAIEELTGQFKEVLTKAGQSMVDGEISSSVMEKGIIKTATDYYNKLSAKEGNSEANNIADSLASTFSSQKASLSNFRNLVGKFTQGIGEEESVEPGEEGKMATSIGRLAVNLALIDKHEKTLGERKVHPPETPVVSPFDRSLFKTVIEQGAELGNAFVKTEVDPRQYENTPLHTLKAKGGAIGRTATSHLAELEGLHEGKKIAHYKIDQSKGEMLLKVLGKEKERKLDTLAEKESEIRDLLERFEAPKTLVEARRGARLSDQIPLDKLAAWWLDNRITEAGGPLNQTLKHQGLKTLSDAELKELDALLYDYFEIETAVKHIDRTIVAGHKAMKESDDQVLMDQFQKMVVTLRPYNRDNPYSRSLLGLERYRGIILREPQTALFLDMLQHPNAVRQLGMGEGKSSVTMTLLAREKAKGNNLVMMVVIDSMYETNRRELDQASRDLLDRPLVCFEFNRGQDLSFEALTNQYRTLLEVVEGKGFVVTRKRDLLSLRNCYNNLCNDPTATIDQITMLAKIRALVGDADVLADEVDAVLDPKITTIFANRSADGPMYMDKEICSMTKEVMELAMKRGDPGEVLLGDYIAENNQANLDAKTKKTLIDKVAGDYFDAHFKKLGLAQNEKELFISYVTRDLDKKPDATLPPFMNRLRSQETEEAGAAFNQIAFVRTFISQGLMASLNKQKDVEYGIDPTNFAFVIPYSGPNKPNIGSVHKSIAEKMAYTTQFYAQTGIYNEYLSRVITQLARELETELLEEPGIKPEETVAAKKFKQLTSAMFGPGKEGTPLTAFYDKPTERSKNQIIDSYRQRAEKELEDNKSLKSFNNTKAGQEFKSFWLRQFAANTDLESAVISREEGLFTLPGNKEYGMVIDLKKEIVSDFLGKINGNMHAKLTFAEREVLGKIEVMPEEVASESEDLVEMVKNFSGFTGTAYNTDTYADKIEPPPPGAPVGNGEPYETLLNPAKEIKVFSVAIDSKNPAESLVQNAMSLTRARADGKKYLALIDVGAVSKGKTDLEVAKLILEQDKDLVAVRYWSETGRKMLLERGVAKPYPDNGDSQVEKEHRDQIFTLYLSQFVGADAVLPDDAEGLVTIGPDTTSRALFQAVWRMRKIVTTQRVDFIMSEDTEKKIKEVLQGVLGSAPEHIGMDEVLMFCLINQADKVADDNWRAESSRVQKAADRTLDEISVELMASDKITPEQKRLLADYVAQKLVSKTGTRLDEKANAWAAVEKLEDPLKILERMIEDSTERCHDMASDLDDLGLEEAAEALSVAGTLVESNVREKTRDNAALYKIKVSSMESDEGKAVEMDVEVELAVEQEVEIEEELEALTILGELNPKIARVDRYDDFPSLSETMLNGFVHGGQATVTSADIKESSRWDKTYQINYGAPIFHSLHSFIDIFGDNLYATFLAERAALPKPKDPYEGQDWYTPVGKTEDPFTRSVFHRNRKPCHQVMISKVDGVWTSLILSEHEAHGDNHLARNFVTRHDPSYQGVILNTGTGKFISSVTDDEGNPILPFDPQDEKEYLKLVVQAKVFNGSCVFSKAEREVLKEWIVEVGDEKFEIFLTTTLLPSLDEETLQWANTMFTHMLHNIRNPQDIVLENAV